MRSIRTNIVVIAASAAMASVALAQPGTPPTDMNLTIQTVDGANWNWQNAGSPGTWVQDAVNPNQWAINGNVTRSTFAIDFGLQLDPDPFISNSFNLTNNTAVTQTYTVTVTLPISPAVAFPSQTFGSVSGSLVDGNGDGASLVTTTGPGSAIYTAIIDGTDYMQLITDPFSISAPPFATTPIGPANFGLLSGQPGANSTIGIRNTFTLSPGDSVNFVSTFLIIPSPGAVSLLALGGLVAARRRRN
jgi:hypothetical protein